MPHNLPTQNCLQFGDPIAAAPFPDIPTIGIICYNLHHRHTNHAFCSNQASYHHSQVLHGATKHTLCVIAGVQVRMKPGACYLAATAPPNLPHIHLSRRESGGCYVPTMADPQHFRTFRSKARVVLPTNYGRPTRNPAQERLKQADHHNQLWQTPPTSRSFSP